MNTIELNCPHCGATIRAEEDLGSFLCPRCGSGIVLQARRDDSVTRDVSGRETAEKAKMTRKKKSLLWGIIVAILLVAVIGGTGFWELEKYTDNQISKSTESVREYIDINNFPRAVSELSIFDGHLFFVTRWESRKSALQKEIEEKEKLYNQSQLEAQQEQQQEEEERQENQDQEALFPVLMTLKEAVNKDVSEVKDAFKLFDNITENPIVAVDSNEAKKAKDGKVKAITIKVDGKEVSPKKGVAIKADAEIVITYYDFSGSTRVPLSSKDAIGLKYEDVERAFNEAGLENTECNEYNEEEQNAPIVEAFQTAWNWVKKPFTKNDKSKTVQAIAIHYNGEKITDFGEGAVYPIDARIVITYYK